MRLLHYGADDFADLDGLSWALGRDRAKDTTLDYETDPAANLEAAAARRYAERRGINLMRPESAIVVRPDPELKTPQRLQQAPSSSAAVKPVSVAELAEGVAQGRARFRDRFETHRRQQAQQAADEAGTRDLVARWDRAVTGFTATLPRLDIDPTYGPARKAMLEFRGDLGAQPGAVAVLRERDDAFGVGERQTLARVVANVQPERAVSAAVETAETNMRAGLQEQAQQRAAQEEARRQELAAQPPPTPRGGPSMEM